MNILKFIFILKIGEVILYFLGFLINRILIKKAKKIDNFKKQYYISENIEKQADKYFFSFYITDCLLAKLIFNPFIIYTPVMGDVVILITINSFIDYYLYIKSKSDKNMTEIIKKDIIEDIRNGDGIYKKIESLSCYIDYQKLMYIKENLTKNNPYYELILQNFICMINAIENEENKFQYISSDIELNNRKLEIENTILKYIKFLNNINCNMADKCKSNTSLKDFNKILDSINNDIEKKIY